MTLTSALGPHPHFTVSVKAPSAWTGVPSPPDAFREGAGLSLLTTTPLPGGPTRAEGQTKGSSSPRAGRCVASRIQTMDPTLSSAPEAGEWRCWVNWGVADRA